MAAIFLDANPVFDIFNQRNPLTLDVKAHTYYISILTIHILAYVNKLSTPNSNLNQLHKYFTLIPLTEALLKKATLGPTADLEDNIQLHSASIANCDQFLTNDKNLLKLGYFGQTQIIKAID